MQGSVSDFVNALPDNFYVNSLKDLVAHHYPDRSRSNSDLGNERSTVHADDTLLPRSKSVSDRPEASADLALSTDARFGRIPCLEHPAAAIELYCTGHNKVLCRICHYTNHSQCLECLSIEGAEHRFIRPRVQQILANINQSRLYLAAKLRRYIRQHQALSVDAFAIQKHIEDTKRILQEKLEAGFAFLKEELGRVVSVSDKDLSEKEESVKMKDSLLEESRNHLEMVSKKCGPLELASLVSVFDIQGEQEPDSCVDDNEIEEEKLVFDISETLQSLIGSEENILGQISMLNGSTETNAMKALGAMACDDKGRKTKNEAENMPDRDTVDAGLNTFDGLSEKMTITSRAKVAEANVVEMRRNVEFTLAIEGSIDMSCVLKSGDIACLKSSEKYVIICRPTGSVSGRVLLPTVPSGLTPCKDMKRKASLALTGYGCKLYFLSLSPKLRLVSSIPTRAQYTGISHVPKRLSLVAVATCEWPPAVDLISLQGMVLKTFSFSDTDVPMFHEPRNLATSLEFLFVPDGKALKVLSWESDEVRVIEGYDCKSYGPTNFGALTAVCAIQDVLLTIDSQEGKLYALWCRGGQWMLTTVLEDKFLLGESCSLTAGNNATVLLSKGREVRLYGVNCLCNDPQSPIKLNLKSPKRTHDQVFDQFRTL